MFYKSLRDPTRGWALTPQAEWGRVVEEQEEPGLCQMQVHNCSFSVQEATARLGVLLVTTRD